MLVSALDVSPSEVVRALSINRKSIMGLLLLCLNDVESGSRGGITFLLKAQECGEYWRELLYYNFRGAGSLAVALVRLMCSTDLKLGGHAALLYEEALLCGEAPSEAEVRVLAELLCRHFAEVSGRDRGREPGRGGSPGGSPGLNPGGSQGHACGRGSSSGQGFDQGAGQGCDSGRELGRHSGPDRGFGPGLGPGGCQGHGAGRDMGVGRGFSQGLGQAAGKNIGPGQSFGQNSGQGARRGFDRGAGRGSGQS